MSSDYYGGVAGEIADRGAEDEAAFIEWLNAYTRRPAEGTYHDDLRAAFDAGAAWGLGRRRQGMTREAMQAALARYVKEGGGGPVHDRL
jgi:hypothetical protein